MKRNIILQRFLAFLLCVSLCISSMPINALADTHASIENTEIPSVEVTVDPETGTETIVVIDEGPIPAKSARAAKDCYSIEEAGAVLRGGMKNREATISVPVIVDAAPSDYTAFARSIFAAAIAHTGNPTEGDYLGNQYGGWKCSFKRETVSGKYRITASYEMKYYSTKAQEEELDAAAAVLLKSLNLNSLNDYEKLKRIYDWICNNVVYDYKNLNNESYTLKYTAYAALVNKTAVCQGYALLLYRLALECGIDIRYVKGQGNGGYHGWNIVKLGNCYYNVDATWDSSWAQVGYDYEYFLKCDANFDDHEREEPYNTAEFYNEYPMANEDYVINNEAPEINIYSLKVSPRNLQLDKEFTIQVSVSDDTSVEYVVVWFLSPNEEREKVIYLDYNSAQDLWMSTQKIDGTWNPGVWQFEAVYAEDNEGNYTYISNSDLYPEDGDMDLSDKNVTITYDEKLMNQLAVIDPVSGEHVYVDDAYIYDTTIDGDVYIGPNALVTFENVKVNGNIYVIGMAELMGVTADKLVANKISQGIGYSFYQGEVYYSGDCNIGSLDKKTYPVTDIPYRIDVALSMDGKVVLRGATLQIADFYVNGQKVELLDGKIIVDDIPDGGDNKVKLEWKTVFGNTITKYVDLEEKLVLDQTETTLTYPCDQGTVEFVIIDEKIVRCSSSDENVATVDPTGVITIKGGKKADLTLVGVYHTYTIHLNLECQWSEEYKVYKEPTCTEAGEKSIYCLKCGVYKEPVEISKKDHTYDAGTVSIKATCEENGLKLYTCTACGARKTETLKSLGHSYSNEFTVDKNPTCIEKGMKSRHCTRTGCNERTEETVLEPLHKEGHLFAKEWTVDKEATCTEEGSRSKHCTRTGCNGKTEVTAIGKLPHTEVIDKAVKPTCTKEGLTEGSHCAVCKAVLKAQQPVEKTDHSYDKEAVTIQPECDKEGVKTYTCTVCQGTKTEVVDKLGHSYSKDFTVDKAATCTEKGSKSKHCTRSGCSGKTEVTVIEKKAHSYDGGKVTTQPTCEKEGVKTYTCTACKASKTEKVNKTGHSYTETVINGALTVKEYICRKCKDSYQVIVEGKRISGTNRFATSIQSAESLKANMGIDKFDTVVLASGLNFADALSGSYLATEKNAPILLVNTFDLPGFQKYIMKNVKPGGTIYVLGGEAAVSEKSIEAFKSSFKVKRLGGANRFETNLLVLQEAGVEGKDLLICTGLNFADSLSASAANRPLLLVMGKSLMADQKEFLKTFAGKKYIIGGTGAVSGEIEKQIGNCERLAGGHRFETSVLIAKTFFKNPEVAVFASAMNFPDGLCGGPLAYQLGGPLILTTEKWEADAKAYVVSNGVKYGVALGGESALSDNTVKTILGKTLNVYK